MGVLLRAEKGLIKSRRRLSQITYEDMGMDIAVKGKKYVKNM